MAGVMDMAMTVFVSQVAMPSRGALMARDQLADGRRADGRGREDGVVSITNPLLWAVSRGERCQGRGWETVGAAARGPEDGWEELAVSKPKGRC